MKIQRRWRRAWQRGKRNYYKGLAAVAATATPKGAPGC